MATIVPPTLFRSCQLPSAPNACILPFRQPQISRVRAAQGFPGTALPTPQWRLRISAESTESVTEETVQTPAEEETVPDSTEAEAEAPKEPSAESAAADHLVMLIKAEGSMPDVSIPVVQTALEEMENVSDVKITAFEGLTSISLTKKTVIQATNVASELVDAMEKAGFRMHTLNLAIDDDE